MADEERTDEEQPDPEPETEQEPDDDAADDDEPDEEPEERDKSNKPKQRPERQAARYRVERNEARRERDALTEERDGLTSERDSLRLELAFTRAAGDRFENIDAAWVLADKSNLSIDVDGAVIGAAETVEAVAEAHPFIVRPDDEPPAKERDPFKTANSSGRVMNGPKKPLNTGPSRAALEAKYPALKHGR